MPSNDSMSRTLCVCHKFNRRRWWVSTSLYGVDGALRVSPNFSFRYSLTALTRPSWSSGNKTVTPISHSSALQWDCCLSLLRKNNKTAKRCGFRKPGRSRAIHSSSPWDSQTDRGWGFFAKDCCRTKGSLMTLATLRWSYLWLKFSRKWDSQPENWFGRSIEEPLKSWPCLSVSTWGHFWTNALLNRSEVFKCVYSVGHCFVYWLQSLQISFKLLF